MLVSQNFQKKTEHNIYCRPTHC